MLINGELHVCYLGTLYTMLCFICKSKTIIRNKFYFKKLIVKHMNHTDITINLTVEFPSVTLLGTN